MPKKNDAGATFYGQEGIVDDAEGNRFQLDPSRNLDGTVVDGFTSDEREIAANDPTDPRVTTVYPNEPVNEDETGEGDEEDGDSPSHGNSSEVSRKSTASTQSKSAKRP